MPKTDQTEDKGKCRCSACGAAFRRLSGFDKHRVGPWSDRRCLTSAQMLEQGLQQDIHRYWRQPAPANPYWRTRQE